MHKIALSAYAALFIAGCFWGGVNDAPDTHAKLIAPGFYVGDYSALADNQGLETEFTLNSDGSFRLFWMHNTDPVYDLRGRWTQKDSGLYFTSMQEKWLNQGVDSLTAIDDDTNAVTQVTDTSFIRKEWTPLRQKPYWIPYFKKTMPTLADGQYQYKQGFADTVPANHITFKITLRGSDFSYSVTQDTVESYQATAKWTQIGSILETTENRQRYYVDSLKAFPSWDSLGGDIVQRLRDVSDTAFHLWVPPSMFDTGNWNVYQKIGN